MHAASGSEGRRTRTEEQHLTNRNSSRRDRSRRRKGGEQCSVGRIVGVYPEWFYSDQAREDDPVRDGGRRQAVIVLRLPDQASPRAVQRC